MVILLWLTKLLFSYVTSRERLLTEAVAENAAASQQRGRISCTESPFTQFQVLMQNTFSGACQAPP